MKKIILILSSCLFTSLFANTVELPQKKFEVRAQNIQTRIDELLAHPENVLKRYRPVGISVKSKTITGNIIEFYATKSVLGISKTVFYRGTLSVFELPQKNQTRCFIASQDFDGSDELIIDNIQKFELTVCGEEKKLDQLSVVVTSKLYKGKNPGGMLGKIATQIVTDQVDPVVLAIKEELEKEELEKEE